MKTQLTKKLYLLLLLFYNISLAQTPVVIKHPVNQGVIEGQTATFLVEATGDSLLYQWYLNDTLLIPGAEDSVFTTPPLTIGANRTTFRCVVANSSGSDTSDNAILFVTATGSRVTEGLQILYNF